MSQPSTIRTPPGRPTGAAGASGAAASWPPGLNGEAGLAGGGLGARVRARVAETVVGQESVVESILIALLTGGHLLLQGVPGLAKTLLVHAVANAIDLRFGRVQFTIDLLPSDIVGSEVLDEGGGGGGAGGGRVYRVHPGPVFTNLLLADEINRATPKVQSALLEAMQERRVTIGNRTHPLPTPFLVIATQNPIEQSGTFELPEAQLDRFMLCQRLAYPTRDEEAVIVRRSLDLGLKRGGAEGAGGQTEAAGAGAAGAGAGGAVPMTAFDAIQREPVARLSELSEAMAAVQRVHVSEVFVQHCVTLIERTRCDADLELGCSPRAGIALTHAARARAYLRGREYATPEDLFALAEGVMLHRMRLNYAAAAAGRTAGDVLRRLLESTW